MSDKTHRPLNHDAQARRDFLKKAATLGATAPAVLLLMNATATPAHAQRMYQIDPPGADSQEID